MKRFGFGLSIERCSTSLQCARIAWLAFSTWHRCTSRSITCSRSRKLRRRGTATRRDVSAGQWCPRSGRRRCITAHRQDPKPSQRSRGLKPDGRPPCPNSCAALWRPSSSRNAIAMRQDFMAHTIDPSPRCCRRGVVCRDLADAEQCSLPPNPVDLGLMRRRLGSAVNILGAALPCRIRWKFGDIVRQDRDGLRKLGFRVPDDGLRLFLRPRSRRSRNRWICLNTDDSAGRRSRNLPVP